MAAEIPTIYEWGGGRDAFARWLNRFYDLVETEAPSIAALFGGKVTEEHREHVTDWWSEVMGGPAVYTEPRGGYEHMLARHHNLAITPEQRLQFVTLLSRAADDVGSRQTPSSARRSWATPNGEPAWRSTTPSPAPTSSSTHHYLAGAGASHRPTSPATTNARS